MSDALSHKCFGCGRAIADHEGHIHVGLDEAVDYFGIAGGPLGLDDILTFAYCSDCTEDAERGWTLEAHGIDEAGS